MATSDEERSAGPQTIAPLIRWHGYAALASVLYVALLGLTMSIKFHAPDWLGGVPWLSWGRIRYAHTQGLFFGWLGNAFLAFLYFAVPRLAGRPVTSARLGWALFVAWNGLVVLPGWALVQAGVSQPLEWAEFPLPIDGAATLGMLLACIQFVVPLVRARVSSLYVSAWYILGGLTFTLLAYPVGNVVPEYLPGALGATFSGLWIHDAVGLFVTPLALAVAYAVIPAVSRQPIYSHFLSMIGFWLLFLLYPLNGTHHYVFSSIPMEAQKGAVVASVYLGADVVLVVTNLLLSLRGRSGTAAADTPLRYVWAGTVVYLIVSLQGSAQAIMPLNRFVHFSDWVIGHSHLAMIGFGSFMALGGLLHAWRLTPGCRYSPRLANWSFWLLALGLAGMVLDLTAAGLVQGQLWQGDLPWMDSVRASAPFWWVRSVSGFVLLAGFVAVVAAITIGPVGVPAPAPVPAAETGEQDDADDEVAGFRWLQECLRAHRRGWVRAVRLLLRRPGALAQSHARGADRPDAAGRPPGPDGKRASGTTGLFPRGLHELPLAARPLHRGRRAAVRAGERGVGERRRRPSDCGERGGSARTWPVREAGSRGTGNWPISGTPGTSSRIRSCPATHGYSTARRRGRGGRRSTS